MDSSIFSMIAGGNKTLRLGACSHLFSAPCRPGKAREILVRLTKSLWLH
jgi:hypothetical protein